MLPGVVTRATRWLRERHSIWTRSQMLAPPSCARNPVGKVFAGSLAGLDKVFAAMIAPFSYGKNDMPM
jgi:hypothetical protein